jgi:phosphatidylinositol glycan class O
VDALRYDFTVPVPQNPEKPQHFLNAIPIFHETAVNSPHNAFLLPFIADPPTTTLQRLKGLTTGTLPTFVDAGSNFAGTAIEEDNLVAQLRNASKRLVHLGDDTWHALFPGYFESNLTHAYDSFNVWDLHTVDNGVTEHLFPLMHPSNTSKWDVLIGHYLGVDHAGHRYGPDHPAMTAKLNQMDGVFRRMIDELDDDTLLVVMGDHGMDAKGDHGGESDDEIQAALWMFSKRGLFGRSSPAFGIPPATAKERSVAQIDLVPTLSLLLGMPIPFNNLGAPIEEAFIGSKGDDYENLAAVGRLTAAQIHRYQQEYALARGLDDSVRAKSLDLWREAQNEWISNSNGGRNLGHLKRAYAAFSVYQSETLSICRALWARFDIPRMINGVTILVASLAILGIYARGIEGDRSEITPVLFSRGLLGNFLGGVVGFGCSVALPSVPRDHVIVYTVAMGSVAGIANALWFLRRRLISPLPNSIWGWMAITSTVALSAGFAANSFTIWEDEILLFFLNTFGVLMAISSFRQKTALERALGCYHSVLFLILTRVASLSRLCREEQMPFCKSTYYASATSSTSATWQLYIPYIVALLLPTFIRSYYSNTRNLQGPVVLWFDFALRFGLLLSAAYWTLDAADDGDWLPGYSEMLKTTKIIIAQITLAIAIAFGYSIFAWSKPFLSIETRANADANAASAQVISAGSTSSITILGYSNVHGSRYAFLITVWLLIITLVQKPMGAGSIALLCWQIFSLLEIIDTNNLSSTAVGPIVLALLGSFHFFKTGHQATLSSIQWETAFIPMRTIRYPWSPLLVLLNTFGAQILCAVAVPAVALWKQRPKENGLLGNVAKAIATHVLFYAVVNFATTLWAGHLRRHLMLYRIFSPRWMTGAVVLLVVDVVCVFVALVGARTSFLSVGEVFGWGSWAVEREARRERRVDQ